MKKAKPEPKVTLADTIYQKIKEDITSHKIVQGEKINVKELAQRYNTSETPIKFALNRLISEKIIVNYPRQGMLVHKITAEEINEVFDIRLMLDLAALPTIIQTITLNDAIRKKLAENIAEHISLVKSLSSDSPVESYMKNYTLDYEFHVLLLKCTGNQKLVEVFAYLNPFLYSTFIFERQSCERNIDGVLEHQQILDAILDSDIEKVKTALTQHIQNAKNTINLILKIDKLI